ncbi:serpin family protein [Actinomycetota bacterium]
MKKIKIVISIVIITTLLLLSVPIISSCSKDSGGKSTVPVVSGEKSDELADKVDSSLLSSNTDFAFNIFNRLIAEDSGQNVFISPLSILLALAMTYNGAVGDTNLAMADAMEFSGMDMEELNQGFSDLMVSILNGDPEVKINIANSIWPRLGFNPKEDFVEINKKYYSSEVNELDFSDPGAVDTINGWIEDATEEKIKEMLKEIPSDAVMYLINAIYFKGDWTYPFEEESTFDEDFNLGDGSKKSVPMMHIIEHFDYMAGDGFGAVRIPYGEEKFSMYIVLPDEGVEIDSVLEGLDSGVWNDLKNGMSNTEVRLAMPKYKMEYGVKLLNGVLKDLGMGIAFTPEADFSNINPDIFISKVMHKAVIEVNEKGSEAAAATVVEMVESAMPEEEMIEFIVDRPFFFIIGDDRSGAVLFMGKVVNP